MNAKEIQTLDEQDPLREMRGAFCLPRDPHGQQVRYFCGHSLGLQPKGAFKEIERVLKDWGDKGVEQWFDPKAPWYTYSDALRAPLAKLAGADPMEVVVMNSLTVNMHLLLASFYRPDAKRYKIIVDGPVFPSDLFALKSQIRFHGLDPESALIIIEGKEGRQYLSDQDLDACLEEHGDSTLLVWFSGVNYFTGQHYHLRKVCKAAQSYGCLIGLDLAHAIGNVPLHLHDWGVDFAVWCHYKYLNSGPGSVGGAFVHEKHWTRPIASRLEGWWGCDPKERFAMREMKGFVPDAGAGAWQLSTPSLLSAASLKASLDLFEKVEVADLRRKSLMLTGLLVELLRPVLGKQAVLITPEKEEERGAQLSLIVRGDPLQCLQHLKQCGIVCDFRKPNVLRAAPAPLYNTFEDVRVLARELIRFLI